MRNARLGVVGIAATAALVTGCGAVPGLPSSGPATNSGSSFEGPTTLVRFVVLETPGNGPVDLIDRNNPSKKFATGLKPGTVTDYLRVPVMVGEVDASGKEITGGLSGIDPKKPRNTMVVGIGVSGPESQLFVEQDGKVDISALGTTMPSGKAILVGSGIGFGKGIPQNVMLSLGQGAGKCVKPADGKGSQANVGVASIPVWFAADPGSVDLQWYTDAECHTAVTGIAKATVTADKQGYVLPWLRDASHFGFLYVPINTDGAGNAGVVDAGVGPTFAAPDTNSTGTPTTTDSPTTTASPTTETTTADTTTSDAGEG